MPVTVNQKIFIARYTGTSTLTLNLTNAPWLSNVVKIIRPSTNTGVNVRQTYTGSFNGTTPGGAVSTLVPGVAYEFTAGIFNNWILPDFILIPEITGSVSPAPTISSFTPLNGNAGTSVTITGTNLANAYAVVFNNVVASFSNNTATSITAVVPALASSGTIKVFTAGGIATSPVSFTLSLPVLATPTNYGASVISGGLSQALSSVPNATSYTYEIATNTAFTQNFQTFSSASTTRNWSGLLASTLYYTRVKATAPGFSDSPYASAQVTTGAAVVTPAAPLNPGGDTAARLFWADQVAGYPSADNYEVVEYPAQLGVDYDGKIYFSIPAAAAVGAVRIRVKAGASNGAGLPVASTVAYTTPPPGVVDVDVIGDSNSDGGFNSGFTTENRAFRNLLTRLLGSRVNVRSFAVGGAKSSDESNTTFQSGEYQVKFALDNYTPQEGRRHLLTYMFGTNNVANEIGGNTPDLQVARFQSDVQKVGPLAAAKGAGVVYASAIEPSFHQTGPTGREFYSRIATYLAANATQTLGGLGYIPVWEDPKLGKTVLDSQAAQFGLPSSQRWFTLVNGSFDTFHWGNDGHAEYTLMKYVKAVEQANKTLFEQSTATFPLPYNSAALSYVSSEDTFVEDQAQQRRVTTTVGDGVQFTVTRGIKIVNHPNSVLPQGGIRLLIDGVEAFIDSNNLSPGDTLYEANYTDGMRRTFRLEVYNPGTTLVIGDATITLKALPNGIPQGTRQNLSHKDRLENGNPDPAATLRFVQKAGNGDWLRNAPLITYTNQNGNKVEVVGGYTLGIQYVASTNGAGGASRIIIRKDGVSVYDGAVIPGNFLYEDFPTDGLTHTFEIELIDGGGNFLVIDSGTIARFV